MNAFTVVSIEAAEQAVLILGFPCKLMPAYTLKGDGTTTVNTIEEFNVAIPKLFELSLIHEVRIEKL